MIGFVAAESREFRGLRRHLNDKRKLRLRIQWAMSGELNGKRVILAANGPGPVLARRAAEVVGMQGDLKVLVSYGFCGALDPALSLNDVFMWGRSSLSGSPPAAETGELLSVDRVAVTASEKAELRKTGARAVDMEAAGVSAYARERNLPFYCIRVITDTANEDLPMDFNQVRDSDGRFSRLNIVARAARDPFKILPALIQFNQRTKSASTALGDFVATCEF